MTLIRWNETFPTTAFDRLFDNWFERVAPERTNVAFAPRVNVWEDADNIFLALELPGLAKEDVKIHVENGRLTISGENKFERDEKKETFHLVERRYGRFERSFNLGDQVDVEKIAAKMDKGILTVTLGKKDISKPKQIEVEVH